MARKSITMFSWGYYGWGSATKQLIQAVDAVEKSRGFKPPIFVDIRLKRQVRAVGFRDHAFENLLGPTRHRWMKSLGNLRIASHSGPQIQIADPAAAAELLDLAIEAEKDGRRVIFFCGCGWPKIDGKTNCHRDRVSTLLLAAARRRGQPIQIVEWPGDNPKIIDLDLPTETFEAVAATKKTFIPLKSRPDLAHFGGLPYGTIVRCHSGPDKVLVVTGPALFQRGQWNLPCFWFCGEEGPVWAKKKADALRRTWGLNSRK